MTRMVNVVPRFSETPGEVRTNGPALGAHTDQVLGESGLGAEDIAYSRGEGVI